MSQLKIRFDEPEHGWMNVEIHADGAELMRISVSDVYPSLHLLVDALLAMLDLRAEKSVDWMQEPAEFEMLFARRGEHISLEISSFSSSFRPIGERSTDYVFSGSYEEICLPFWRALRNLEGRYSPEELANRWTEPFPHRELALLTERMGK